MKRESKFVISLGCILLVVLVGLVSVNLVFGAAGVSNNLSEAQKYAYSLGIDLDKFLELSPKAQKNILKKHLDSFMEGYSKNEKNGDKILEFWIKKDDEGKNVLGDEVKNKLWKYFVSNDKANDHLKNIANKLFDQTYKDIKWADPSKVGIKEVLLEKPENLIWKGNKLGIADDGGNLTLWIDLENIPRWMTKIGFDGEKFDLEFNTGYGIKNVKLKGGSIGISGELIGPDGKVIGARMGENLKSIKYNNEKKQFEIKYNFKGEEKTLTLGVNDLNPKIRDKIMGFVDDKGLVGDKLRGVLGDLDGAGIEGGVAAQNVLNVLYGGDKDRAEVIEVEYNDKGEPEIRVSDGGTVVTLNSQGGVERTYTHWATEEDEDYTKDEKGIFKFSSSGEIKAARNAILDVVGFGQTHFSRDELIGVDIIRNSFVDAVLRGDKKALLEAVFKKGAGVIDELGLSLSLRELQQEGYKMNFDGTNLQKIQVRLMNILMEELENPDLATEYQTKLQDTLNLLTSNLEQSGNNLLDYALVGERELGGLSERERELIGGTRTVMANEFGAVVEGLLSDPEKVKELLRLKESTTNEFIRNYLKGRVDPMLEALGVELIASEVRELAGDPFVARALEEAGRDPTEINSNTLKTRINKKIDNINFHEMIKKARESGGPNWQDSVSSSLMSSLSGVSDSEKEQVGNAVTALLSEINGKVEKETTAFQERIKAGLEGTEYENRVVIDTYLNEVYVKSDRVVIFDSDIPLNEFRAESTRTGSDHSESVIQLWSRGNKVATFDGEETRVERVGGQRDYASIERIVNGRTGDVLKLGTNNYGYSLYDPLKLVHKSSGLLSIGWRRAHSILQTTVMGPEEGDIAANPDSSVTMTVGGSTLISKLIMKFAGGIPISSMGGDAAKTQIEGAIQKLRDIAGGEQNLNNVFNEVDGWLSYIEKTGAEVPQIITDTYYVSKNLRELDKVAEFIGNTPNLQSGSQIVFTGTYIDIDGRRLTVSPEIHRDVLRAIAANPVKRHWNFREAIGIQKQGGAQFGDLF